MMKSLLLALAAVPLCVFASDQAPKCDAEGGQACFEAAIEYHRAQAYDKALLCAEKSCMEGHGGGCFYLGFARQQKGEHAQSNPFYEKACSAGYAAGCLSLGNNYRLGLGAEVSWKSFLFGGDPCRDFKDFKDFKGYNVSKGGPR